MGSSLPRESVLLGVWRLLASLIKELPEMFLSGDTRDLPPGVFVFGVESSNPTLVDYDDSSDARHGADRSRSELARVPTECIST